MHIWILVTFFVHLWFYIRTSLPLARRYIAKHFKGRAGWNDKKIRHVFFLLPHTGGLTGRRLLVFCSVVPLRLFGLVKKLDWQQRWKRRRRPFFLIKLYMSVCACVFWTPPTPPHPLPFTTPTPILLSPLTHINAHPSSETERRKEFILPVPALSVKLIRLWAPDNSIISDSFNNRNPPPPPHNCKRSSHTILPHITVFLNSSCWQERAESTGTVPGGQSITHCLRQDEGLFLSCLILTQHFHLFFVAVLLQH